MNDRLPLDDFTLRHAENLLDMTEGCRPDMHEPDEQGIEAIVTGYILDNAGGNKPSDNFGEFTVGLRRDDGERVWFNLASLIALARIGAKIVLTAKYER